MWPWMLWWEMWMRAAIASLSLPYEVMAAASEPVRTITPETEEYLVRKLREELEAKDVQGIIDEGGRR